MNTRTPALLSLSLPLILSPLAPAQCDVYVPREYASTSPQEYAQFGSDTDISGDWFILAADSATVGPILNAGAATFFRRIGTNWVFSQTIHSPNPTEDGYFGSDVALDAGRAVVGDPNGGAAHIFLRDAQGFWNLEQSLIAPDGVAQSFGTTVDIEGDVVAVGDAYQANEIGAVYIFRRIAGSFVFEAKLQPLGAAAETYFGNALDLDPTGTRLAVGADNFGPEGNQRGGAFVYRFNGSAWTLEASLTAPTGDETYYFGESIAIDGDRLAVGASGERIAPFDNAGAVHLFAWNGAAWTHEASLTAPAPAEYAYFGDALDLSGDRLIVGSISELNAAMTSQTGGAYIFERGPAAQDGWTLTAILNNFGEATEYAGESVSIDGSTAVLGASGTYVEGTGDAGAVYVVALAAPAPVITLNPADQSVNAGEAASFEVAATGVELTYQWRMNGRRLADSAFPASITGAHSATLVISEAYGESGVIDCIVDNACGNSTASAPAVLTINTPSPCPGDADGNGVVNFLDVIRVLANFNMMCP